MSNAGYQRGGVMESPPSCSVNVYNRLMNLMEAGVSRHLADTCLTVDWANDYFYRITGYTEIEYRERFQSLKEYFEEWPEDFHKLSGALENALDTGQAEYTAVCRMPVKNGGFKWIRLRGMVTGECLGGCRIVYHTYEDVGGLIRMQDELKEAMCRSEQDRLAKSDFLSRMSHDIRTPMNAIMGMTRLASECQGNPPRTAECLQKIRLAADTLLILINDMLDIYKIESGRILVNIRKFKTDRLVRKLASAFEAAAREKRISFRVEISPQSAVLLNSDELKIEHILTNLLGNAFKYTQSGGSISLTVDTVPRQAGENEIRFAVTDTGIGIDAGSFSSIFEPFERGKIDKEKYSGSGLGLAVAQNYAEALGGRIEVKSILGQGSTFALYLPLPDLDLTETEKEETEDMEEAGPEKIKREAPERRAGGEKRMEGRRILLIEDNEVNQEIAKCLLESRGFLVDTADNGQEGIEAFAQKEEGYYHAILMDIQMPVVNGLEAAKKIRRLFRRDALTIPIIAMSANAFPDDIEKSLAAGMNLHVSKPFEIEELMNILLDL